ncbi:hypothetical protein Q7C36_007783 [Tachysurus vachellii]|uniref:Uncharacterized protein n=1 Tax=Tachysurus vachellii TaxID=175792 RepID=A0AA88N8Z4_TACVA|nr:hypothetical protein Q7C36_007783 [Tachysurus vachellii]
MSCSWHLYTFQPQDSESLKLQSLGTSSAAPDGGSEAVCSVTDFSEKLDPLILPSELQSGDTLSDCAL